MGVPVTSVDFHFDIMYPWAFQASAWMREIRDRLGLEVRWCFFSLEEINRAEGKKHPWQREWSYGWSMMRFGALLRRIDPDCWTAGTWPLARRCTWRGKAAPAGGRRGAHRPARARSGPGRPRLGDPSTHDEVRADHDRRDGFAEQTAGLDEAAFAARVAQTFGQRRADLAALNEDLARPGPGFRGVLSRAGGGVAV